MCRAIRAHNPRPVQGKHDPGSLESHIMHDRIMGALHKGRINRHHGFEPASGHGSGKRDRVLFGNPHVKTALRENFLKISQTGP